jgi:hypothetical protein
VRIQASILLQAKCLTDQTGKQKITDQIAQLKYKEPNSPRIVVLEQELVRAEAESLVAEAQLSNITREKLKAAFTYQFDALREHCEKLAIIANFGKHLLELIDDTPVTPGETRNAYDGYEASKAYVPFIPTFLVRTLTLDCSIIQDCEDALTNWVTQNAAVKPQLSTRARTLSQRRHKGTHESGQPVDLASQDRPLGGSHNDAGLWVPASEHQSGAIYSGDAEEDDEDEDEVATAANGEQQAQQQRGREDERALAA